MCILHILALTLSSLGPNLMKLMPGIRKNDSTLSVFISKIKSWTTDNSPSRLCKIFVEDLGLIHVNVILSCYLFFKYSPMDPFQ